MAADKDGLTGKFLPFSFYMCTSRVLFQDILRFWIDIQISIKQRDLKKKLRVSFVGEPGLVCLIFLLYAIIAIDADCTSFNRTDYMFIVGFQLEIKKLWECELYLK